MGFTPEIPAAIPVSQDIALSAELPIAAIFGRPNKNDFDHPVFDETVNVFAAEALSIAIADGTAHTYHEFLQRVVETESVGSEIEKAASAQLNSFDFFSKGFSENEQPTKLTAGTREVRTGESVSLSETDSSLQRLYLPEDLRTPRGETLGLDHQGQIALNRRFIDARHHDAALYALQCYYGFADRNEGLQHLYEYYTNRAVNPDADYSPDAWNNFKRANDRTQEAIYNAEGLSVRLIAEINGIIRKGSSGSDPVQSSVRDGAIVCINRDAADILDVFSPDVGYDSTIPGFKASFEGFMTESDRWKTIRVELPEGPQDITVHDAINQLAVCSLHASHDSPRGPERISALRKSLGSVMKANPHDVALEPGESPEIAIYFLPYRIELVEQLQFISEHAERETQRISSASFTGKLSPGSDEYVAHVSRLAAQIGRAVDITHFARDGGGRTGLLIERYMMQRFGLDLPDVMNGYHQRVVPQASGIPAISLIPRENGVYMLEDERAEQLEQATGEMGVDPQRCVDACAILRAIEANYSSGVEWQIGRSNEQPGDPAGDEFELSISVSQDEWGFPINDSEDWEIPLDDYPEFTNEASEVNSKVIPAIEEAALEPSGFSIAKIWRGLFG